MKSGTERFINQYRVWVRVDDPDFKFVSFWVTTDRWITKVSRTNPYSELNRSTRSPHVRIIIIDNICRSA